MTILHRVLLLFNTGCYYYNNATITIEGIELPLRDVVTEFFNSAAWVETQIALQQFYDEVTF